MSFAVIFVSTDNYDYPPYLCEVANVSIVDTVVWQETKTVIDRMIGLRGIRPKTGPITMSY